MRNDISAAFEDYPVIRIVASLSVAFFFRPIFQHGFLFSCRVGLSIGDLLLHQLGLDEELVEKKISTIFLDAQCIDDINSAILKNGSVVALSSALPGLAGATLRRGGFYAGLRDSITYHKDNISVPPEQGFITIKVFNLLMEELGHVFLKKGIIVNSSTAADFFQTQKEPFWKEIKNLHLNGKKIIPSKLTEAGTYEKTNYIKIHIDEEFKSQ